MLHFPIQNKEDNDAERCMSSISERKSYNYRRESGSGKTTLASLMMGFWQPQTGTIRLGGENITELSERNIADYFSMVQQEVFLFNTTIRDNIRIGRPTATQKEVETAAQRAHIHDLSWDCRMVMIRW